MKNGNKLALIIAIIIVFTFSTTSLAKEPNLEDAVQIATQENKHIFIVISTDDFENQTLNDEKIMEVLDEKYVTTIIHLEKQSVFKDIETPIMMLIDSNGTVQEHLDGYYGPEELLEYL